MKSQSSIKGLSAIEQQSDRDQNSTIRIELAKLNNQQFLNYYFQFKSNLSITQQYKNAFHVPIPQPYSKIKWNSLEEKADLFKRQVKKCMQKGFNANLQFIKKDQLKKMAENKKKQLYEQEQLASSRKKKQESFYEQLKSSRKDYIVQSHLIQQEEMNEHSNSNDNSPTKDIMTELSVQDFFLRLEILGQKRDHIKKTWYSLQNNKRPQQKRRCLQQWRKHHKIMQQILKLLLQKLNKQIGTVQVFTQLNKTQSTLLSKSNYKSKSMLQYEKTLASTRIDRNNPNEQTKIINRFSGWNNKLMLDQSNQYYICRINLAQLEVTEPYMIEIDCSIIR